MEIATKTITWVTFRKIPPHIAMVILGSLEWMIGVGSILHKWMPFTLFLLYFQMIGSCLPLIIFRDEI